MIIIDPPNAADVHREIFRVTDSVDYTYAQLGGLIVGLFTQPGGSTRYRLVLGNQGDTDQHCDAGISALDIEGNVALILTAARVSN